MYFTTADYSNDQMLSTVSYVSHGLCKDKARFNMTEPDESESSHALVPKLWYLSFWNLQPWQFLPSYSYHKAWIFNHCSFSLLIEIQRLALKEKHKFLAWFLIVWGKTLLYQCFWYVFKSKNASWICFWVFRQTSKSKKVKQNKNYTKSKVKCVYQKLNYLFCPLSCISFSYFPHSLKSQILTKIWKLVPFQYWYKTPEIFKWFKV